MWDVFCIVESVFCVRYYGTYIMCYVLCTMVYDLCIMCYVFCICVMDYVLSVVHDDLWCMYYVLCVLYLWCVWCVKFMRGDVWVMYYALCVLYCRFLRFVLCIMDDTFCVMCYARWLIIYVLWAMYSACVLSIMW